MDRRGPSHSPRVRHKVRGSTYKVLGTAVLQVAAGTVLADMAVMVVYVSESDGSMWVRSAREFNDGRFEDAPKVHRKKET